MKNIMARVRDAGIFEEMSATGTPHTNRYATDVRFRERAVERARKWNADHRPQHLANNARWAAIHGAEAARRYRQRQKAALHAR